MELIDRYLQSVKLALPKAQQNDVIRELTDEILSQVEERESAFGRQLTEDEQVAMLKQLGHPMMLAARYRKQQYLIGPVVFPIYWIVLRWVMVVVVAMSIGSVMLSVTGAGLAARSDLSPVCRWPLSPRLPPSRLLAHFWIAFRRRSTCSVIGMRASCQSFPRPRRSHRPRRPWRQSFSRRSSASGGWWG